MTLIFSQMRDVEFLAWACSVLYVRGRQNEALTGKPALS